MSVNSFPGFSPSCPPERELRGARLTMNILISNWIGPGVELRIGKGVRILFVSFRDVNFGFWSHLGCSGQNVTIFSREGLVSVGVALEKYKSICLICIFLIRFRPVPNVVLLPCRTQLIELNSTSTWQ